MSAPDDCAPMRPAIFSNAVSAIKAPIITTAVMRIDLLPIFLDSVDTRPKIDDMLLFLPSGNFILISIMLGIIVFGSMVVGLRSCH
jgi:hypothetical protein